MIIAFPIQANEGLDGILTDHFGRAPHFVIYETELKEFRTINNTAEHFGGRAATPMLLEKNKVNILICRGLGRRAIARFEELGMAVYITKHQNVKQALESYNKGELPLVTEEDGCAGRHGQ
ncbi:MAG: dinitrogenase iron-molybdenum cofactor biosynthesis protein [Asgard group archaeon]|nr:dinitrogenase iron-molybdenum cofactor biosynthesis protein [Asgard group archaeon]